jgi:hypothetical protein
MMGCKNREAAISALETMAAAMQGTQREALLSVRDWVVKNTVSSHESGEAARKLERLLLTPSEEEEKAWLWYLRREEAKPDAGVT